MASAYVLPHQRDTGIYQNGRGHGVLAVFISVNHA